MAAEIALIELDLAVKWGASIELIGNDLAQPMIEKGAGFVVQSDQIRRRSRGHAGDEKLSQTILLLFC